MLIYRVLTCGKRGEKTKEKKDTKETQVIIQMADKNSKTFSMSLITK